VTAVDGVQSSLDSDACPYGHGHELATLRQRVEDLEFTVAEYRDQMSQIFGSASWKLTSPVRGAAARYRTAKIRARRAARRIKNGKSQSSDQKVLTSGLFMPRLADLPETSPLRAEIDVNALRRPEEADGPLRRPIADPTVLVVAHVHYPELWGDIDDRLSRMPCEFDLIVTVTEGTAEQAVPVIMRKHRKARIELVANKGRDWAPTLMLANRGLLSGYDAVAKVHTKKSEHRIDGDGWRLALLDGIFESPEQIQRTIDLLREDRSVGLVVPTGHVAGTEHWGTNQGIVEALAYRLPMAFDPDELRFPAGSMFWCRPWLLERMADLDIGNEHFEPEAGQYDATTAHALERLVGIFSTVAGMDIVEAMDVRQRLAAYRKSPQVRPSIYVFYLPQYHRCPENDEFWGEGFTDWDNVKKAKPLFEGHRQPILPSDEVGFYDLKDPEVLRKQAKTAKDHGIDGFVFHYYWFDGRKVLDTPINNWLADPTIDLPLAICWANEPWTRRWDGLDRDVLIPQAYGGDWANRFWEDISPILKDPRYIQVEGAPMLVIYRAGDMPDPVEAIETWRKRATDDGHPSLHVILVAPSRDFAGQQSGLERHADATITFPPGSGLTLESLSHQDPISAATVEGDVYAYASCFSGQRPEARSDEPMRSVFPGWDNTARRGANAFVFHGSDSVSWAGALRSTIAATSRALFANSWNEWAEGACLEPSLRMGSSHLRSVIDVRTSGT
jgi:lipopolysaccharide biosynthesis protein